MTRICLLSIGLGLIGLVAESSPSQEPGRTRPIVTADSAGGFVLRRLDGPIAPDASTWIQAAPKFGPGTIEAPDRSFRLILDRLTEAGDVARFRATVRPAIGGLPALLPDATSYALVSPDSRWIVFEPLDVLDVRAWRLYRLSTAFGVQPYVVPQLASVDGRRLIVSRRACAFDCPEMPTEFFELTFPQQPIADAFPIVAGTGYEGAIVPATSTWHQFSARASLPGALRGWTPGVADIDVAETHLAAFFRLALSAPAKAAALVPPAQRPNVIAHLPEVLKNSVLRRQYYGVTAKDGTKIVLVHAFVTQGEHWRSSAMIMFDGGCSQMWLELSLSAGVQRFECGGFAHPAPQHPAPSTAAPSTQHPSTPAPQHQLNHFAKRLKKLSPFHAGRAASFATR
jgi:hypothetical protein